MANSIVKFRKEEKNTKKSYFSKWLPLTFYLGGSVLTFGDDAYIVNSDYTSSKNFQDDLNNNDLKRLANPSLSGDFALGPYYVRSGNSRVPTITQNDIKWLGSQYALTRVRVDFAGAGDGLSDGGYPWGAYNFYFYFKKIDL